VTPNRDTRPYTGIVTHRLAMGDALLESTFSLGDLNTSVTPQGPLGMTVLPTGNSGNYFADQQRHSHRLEWNELWSLRPTHGCGSHKIQIGSSFAHATDQGRFNAKTITLYDPQGVKIRTIDFTGGSPFDRNDNQPAIFVQDHWSINSRLAIDAGMRAESQTITATTRYAPGSALSGILPIAEAQPSLVESARSTTAYLSISMLSVIIRNKSLQITCRMAAYRVLL
jgi:outer membrane receptor protein involved in Fe transport